MPSAVGQQWFSGNPLNRSAGDRKSAAFVDCALRKSSSLFLPVATSDDGRSMMLLARDCHVYETGSGPAPKSAAEGVEQFHKYLSIVGLILEQF